MKLNLVSQLILLNYVAFIFLLSCNYNSDNILSCEKLKQMMVKDQLYRDDTRTNPIVYIIDSLSGGDTSKHELFFSDAVEIFNKRDHPDNFTKGFINKEEADSLFNLQKIIDKRNLLTIHRYLENIELNRIDTLSCFMDVIIILAHSPKELRTKTISLIEKKKAFIHPNSYNYLKKRLKF